MNGSSLVGTGKLAIRASHPKGAAPFSDSPGSPSVAKAPTFQENHKNPDFFYMKCSNIL